MPFYYFVGGSILVLGPMRRNGWCQKKNTPGASPPPKKNVAGTGQGKSNKGGTKRNFTPPPLPPPPPTNPTSPTALRVIQTLCRDACDACNVGVQWPVLLHAAGLGKTISDRSVCLPKQAATYLVYGWGVAFQAAEGGPGASSPWGREVAA